MMKQLDELDRRIIQILEEDSRTVYTKIANELQVPAPTINIRIKKFKNSNIIKKFTISISPERGNLQNFLNYILNNDINLTPHHRKMRRLRLSTASPPIY